MKDQASGSPLSLSAYVPGKVQYPPDMTRFVQMLCNDDRFARADRAVLSPDMNAVLYTTSSAGTQTDPTAVEYLRWSDAGVLHSDLGIAQRAGFASSDVVWLASGGAVSLLCADGATYTLDIDSEWRQVIELAGLAFVLKARGEVLRWDYRKSQGPSVALAGAEQACYMAAHGDDTLAIQCDPATVIVIRVATGEQLLRQERSTLGQFGWQFPKAIAIRDHSRREWRWLVCKATDAQPSITNVPQSAPMRLSVTTTDDVEAAWDLYAPLAVSSGFPWPWWKQRLPDSVKEPSDRQWVWAYSWE
ncbi:MAG: hypothetical protein IT439_11860 [Phycisphaerales bacterium]|nr:hypothetical protein [Phycisphaerales bacterium]